MNPGIGHNNPPDEFVGNVYSLHRGTHDHKLVGAGQPVKPADPSKGSYSRFEAWTDMVRMAKWKAQAERTRGKSVKLNQGEFLGGYSFLANRWNWTVKQVRGFLEKLINEGMILLKGKGNQKGQRGGHSKNVVSLCNYSRYQLIAESLSAQLGQPKGQPVGNQQGNQQGNNKGNVGELENRHNSGENCHKINCYGQTNGQPTGQPTGQTIINTDRIQIKERESSAREENSSLKIEENSIEGPGFRIDLAAVDMTATLMGYDPAKARKLATVMAMDWTANNFAPDSPIAKIKWALKNDHNDDQQQAVRIDKLQQKQSFKSSKNDQDQADREETKRLIMEKMNAAARV